ncbi:hypothetical protein QFC22_001899 [Naganishia vaughanmartiniae]|uniref:Uncharacterized protein n=1 Tax=Naganishia vaughanmartiniae TaxID=1424756 RepID=A0ACC2XGT3_9TREE|nr:hypothetical protein QFC22_001899 [Naganishia vaughanmartiniae]
MARQLTRATQQVTAAMATQQAEVSLEDQTVLDSIRENHEKSRPKATTASYKGPQKEYRDWCLRREVEMSKKVPLEQLDEVRRSIEESKRTLVTGSRVAVFLSERVSGREHRSRAKGKKVTRAESPATEITGQKTVGWKTMARYLCALCDLQKAQASTTNAVLVSPRAHPEVQALDQTLKRKNAELKKSHHNDRAQGAKIHAKASWL